MSEIPSREIQVAEHLDRYGLTTELALKRMIFPEMTEKAVARLTERYVQSKWLTRRRLPGGGNYFTYGERAVKEHSTWAKHSEKYGYQALVSRLGVLYFCAKLDTNVFSPQQFRTRYPELCPKGMTSSNY